ncbi:MAG: sodium-dependent transporter [Muribaculaceae bacterium]|nr:sodium-dependent transporter [Muribaculaceae bacterium]
MTERAQFVTRLGAIAATVGSAVGLGNIWGFPCSAGSNGGGAFLLIYLGCVFLVGIPVILCEFVIGRGTHKNVSGALKQLAPGTKLHWFSYVGICASIMILSFYSVICGWVVEYLIQAISGNLSSQSSDEYEKMFGAFVSNPWRSSLWTLLFLLINFLVLRRGIKKGIEKVANLLMPILFVILIVFCVNALTLDTAKDGLSFLFHPDFSKLTPKVAISAMGQAFFSLSIGLSCILTYASYFRDSDPLFRNATIVALLDTLVALLAGIMIFPVAISFIQGTGDKDSFELVFVTLPNLFNGLPGGGFVWSVLFFLLLFFASLTSTISMSEISISFFQEEHGMSRTKATGVNTIVCMVFGVLCAQSFGVLSDFTIFGKTIFGFFIFLSNDVLLPLGGVFFAWFVGWFIDKKFVDNQLTNFGTSEVSVWRKPLMFCIRYIAPMVIVVIFLYGLGLFDAIL